MPQLVHAGFCLQLAMCHDRHFAAGIPASTMLAMCHVDSDCNDVFTCYSCVFCEVALMRCHDMCAANMTGLLLTTPGLSERHKSDSKRCSQNNLSSNAVAHWFAVPSLHL